MQVVQKTGQPTTTARRRIDYSTDGWGRPMRVGQRVGDKGVQVVYRSGYDPDPRNWNWVEAVYFAGSVIIFGIVVAGFVLLVIQGQRCCL
jgi:hypothetical protein